MSPLLDVSSSDKCAQWMTVDLRDDEDVAAIVFFPLFGKSHHAGMDCWCGPRMDAGGVIVHETSH